MIRNVLESIDGVAAYPSIALIFFMLVFIGIVIWVFRQDKSKYEELRHLPLDNMESEVMIGEKSDG